MHPLTALDTTDAALHDRLCALARSTPWLIDALRAVRDQRLPEGAISAGAVRNLVWDHLHGFATPSALPDVDAVYCDPTDLSPEAEARWQAALHTACPALPWEVTNQAAVYRWLAPNGGQAVAPFTSVEAGVASWPETATCVALRLRGDGTLQVIAPHGLEDLFAMVVRHNAVGTSVETYRERVAQKRFGERWPLVRVVAG